MQGSNVFELFRQELQNDQSSFRINTIHKIPIVCTLINTETIKTSLLPYLQSLIKREDDEIVFAIADQLSNIASFLGAQHTIVLPYLQSLCAHDQTVVRDKAVSSISKLCQKYSDNEISNYLIPLIIRLATNESNFTYRVSSVYLMCKIYPRAGNHKQKLRQKFLDISNQQMLLLQRVTTIKLIDLCHIYQKQYILQDIISILKQRSSDQKNQDQIRALAVQSFKDISKVLNRDQNKAFMMPLIIQAAQDKSWRVRLCLSKNFPLIASNFGKQMTDMSLIQTLANLLKDSQVDVKIQAVKSLKSFIKVISPQKINILVPQILNLGKDSLGIVRANVGLAIKVMLQAISKDQAYQYLLPLIKQLMKDDSQQVRKGGIQSATKFIQVLGPQTISSLSTSLKTCSQDPKWRVRLQLLRNISLLGVKLQNYDFFIKHIQPIYLNYLIDRASAIRKLGVSMISPLAKCYGDDWLGVFFPKLQEVLQKQTSYHFIISAINSIRQIYLCPLGNLYTERCISNLSKTCQSQVPNVRQVSIKSLRDICFASQKLSVKDQIKKLLNLMKNDLDTQTKTIATQALDRL